jgi:hypothetical protein
VILSPGDIVRKRGGLTQYRLDGFFDRSKIGTGEPIRMARMRPLISITGFIATEEWTAADLEVVRPGPVDLETLPA